MHRLTRTRLYRHLDAAIEILRPEVADACAVEILMALLILKRASDQMVTGEPEIIERAVTIEK